MGLFNRSRSDSKRHFKERFEGFRVFKCSEKVTKILLEYVKQRINSNLIKKASA